MAKRDVMDVWSALQWVVRDQKADKAFAANDETRMLSPGGSVTGAMARIGELRARIDGGGIIRGADLDADAELIWMNVLMLDHEWRNGALAGMIGNDLPGRMAGYMAACRVEPVRDMVNAARSGDMPFWYPGGVRVHSAATRREVEESRLEYIMIWDMLSLLATRLGQSTRLGIVIELPAIARLPWNSRKKMFDKCG
ncbi:MULTISPECIES: hypothetical protein [Thalassospira]|jgi:hypothetical protein|nr:MULTISPECIES: hypothetical protein [Thalassospira]MBL4839380.1 hypothetical protein [Thalassospira sp.]MCD1593130.1 hypothetical protein [Thalassospira xiamenensis]PXX36266.1 hypothetical protein C7967_101659 [Thalassospira sp. 11-3]QPL37470.1 hypothetical protein IT971_09355 [Thalassospira sp. B30-1]